MIVPYLRRLISDQANRAQSLACMIPDTQVHPNLENLASECRSSLAQQRQLLASASTTLDSVGEDGATPALKIIKICDRNIGAVERYGMPPLHCQSKESRLLNQILFLMHREVGLEFPCPAVSCTSNEHYFTHVQTNTVFVPLSEAEFLLHMPDFYHELGHHFYSYAVSTNLLPIVEGIGRATSAIDDYYKGLEITKRRHTTPPPVRTDIEWMMHRWKGEWLEEAFCDLFALFAAGPAYAWANLHLVSKSSPEIYRLDMPGNQTHPSDEARMRMLDAGLVMLGNARDAARIRELWDTMPPVYSAPTPAYEHAFPAYILDEITAAVIGALRQAGLRGHADATAEKKGAGTASISATLNSAFESFWEKDQGGFREAERKVIAQLASIGVDDAAQP